MCVKFIQYENSFRRSSTFILEFSFHLVYKRMRMYTLDIHVWESKHAEINTHQTIHYSNRYIIPLNIILVEGLWVSPKHVKCSSDVHLEAMLNGETERGKSLNQLWDISIWLFFFCVKWWMFKMSKTLIFFLMNFCITKEDVSYTKNYSSK